MVTEPQILSPFEQQQMNAAILAGAPDIDHVSLLRCLDGVWRLAYMTGDQLVLWPLEAKVGDAAGLERIMRKAACTISAIHAAKQGEPDGP